MKVNPYKKLISLGSVYTLGSITENGLSFLLLPILTVYLSVADYGVVGMMTALMALLSAILQAPFSAGFQRYYYQEGYKEHQGKMLFTGLFLILIPSCLIALGFFFYQALLAQAFLGNEDFAYVFEIYALIVLFFPFQQLLLALLRIQQKAKTYVALNVIRLVTYVGLVLFLLIYLDMGLKGLVLGYLYKSVFDVIVLFPYLLRNLQFTFDFSHIKPLLRYGYPLILVTVSLTIMNVTDRFVLKFFDPSLNSTGLYSFGYKFGAIVGILLTVPMKNTVNPIIMEIEKNTNELKAFLSRSTSYFYIIGIFLFLGLALFSREIVQFVAQKESFWASWVVIPVIAFAFVLDGMKDLFGKGLVMAKKTMTAGLILTSGAVLNIGLNFLLIPSFNISGAAFATLLSFGWVAAVNIIYSNKYYPIGYNWNKLIKTTALAVSILGVSMAINFMDLSLLAKIVTKTLLLAVFVWTVWEFDYLTKSEKELLTTGVLRIKNKITPFY